MTFQELEQKLEEEWDDYFRSVSCLARSTFANAIKPFLERFNGTLVTGNGCWLMRLRDGDEAHDLSWAREIAIEDKGWTSEELDELDQIIEIMNTEVRGMAANDLGSLMPDYDPDD